MSDIDIIHGDCLSILPTLATASVDAVVTDPPAGIGFMGVDWDSYVGRSGSPRSKDEWDWIASKERPRTMDQAHRVTAKQGRAFRAFLEPILAECLRVAKPGARALIWALPRTSHWTGTAIEDAGWLIEDRVSHLFGCLSDDTEILTDRGWEPYRKGVEFGRVLAYNNIDGTFRWEGVQETLAYEYAETAYAIRSDRTDQIVSRNHRCLVRRDDGYRFVLAEDAAKEGEIDVPVVEDLRGLLDAFPLQQCDSVATEQGLFQGLLQSPDRSGQRGEEEARSDLHEMRQTVPTEGQTGESPCEVSILRGRMRDCRQDGRSGDRRTTEDDEFGGACGLDGGIPLLLPGEDVGRQQPCLEGRGDDLQDARQLRGSAVRPMSRRVPLDGTQGRLCDGASPIRRPCDGAMLDESGSRPSCGSRPDQQRPDEPAALRQQSGSQTVRASRFAVADLATIEPVEYRGIVWCVRVPSGAFVARRNGKVFVTGNSGFPKAKSRLKPACEDWWLARKPSRGVPPLNIDDCRIESGERALIYSPPKDGGCPGVFREGSKSDGTTTEGRWPANVALTCCGEEPHAEDCPVAMLDAQSGELRAGEHPARASRGLYKFGGQNTRPYHTDTPVDTGSERTVLDSGGASRFFFCSKAPRKDRGDGNNHPTVKNTDLMAWLIKLITQPGDLVLDPFAGSGSTLVACYETDRRCIGIEQNPEYVAIVEGRIKAARLPLFAPIEDRG